MWGMFLKPERPAQEIGVHSGSAQDEAEQVRRHKDEECHRGGDEDEGRQKIRAHMFDPLPSQRRREQQERDDQSPWPA